LFGRYIAIDFELLNAFFAASLLVFREVYGFDIGDIGQSSFEQLGVGSSSWLDSTDISVNHGHEL